MPMFVQIIFTCWIVCSFTCNFLVFLGWSTEVMDWGATDASKLCPDDAFY